MARRRERRHGQGPYPLCHLRGARPLPHQSGPSLRIGRSRPTGGRVTARAKTRSSRRCPTEPADEELQARKWPSSRSKGRWDATSPSSFAARQGRPDRSKTMFPDLTRDDVFRLETRRLWLRWPRQADAQAIVRLAGEKAVAEMTARLPHPYPAEAADRFILEARRANTEGRGLTAAITRKGNGPIGMVGIAPSPEDGLPHLGYWLGAGHWGQGYATEAARAMIDAFFAYTDGRELNSSARVVNPASRRVLEKCGFAFQGAGLMAFPAGGGVFPVDRFRLDRRMWESLKSWSHTGFVREVRSEEAPIELAAVH